MPKFSIVVRPYKCSARPNAKWVLNVWYPTGKRQRRYFETKEAALAEQAAKQVGLKTWAYVPWRFPAACGWKPWTPRKDWPVLGSA